ncbi:MAG: hypothetical protein ACXWX5_10960 [Actinomycetota bacterium]
MTLESISFEGHECLRLEREAGALMVTTSVGPRIIGLFGGGDNMLAVLPGSTIDRPNGEPFRLLGGHRLWAAPEVPRITYEPDDRACAVTEVEGGVRVEAAADGAGLSKAIEVRRSDTGWIVDHEIRNVSGGSITLAAWAITQFPLGGEVDVPASTDATGPQADRSLVLWPYTDPGDVRLHLRSADIRVDAAPGSRRFKIGVAPSRGRVSYRKDGEVFEKYVDVDPSAQYADLGAAIQVFVCDDFCELESLGPLREVAPDGLTRHRERWIVRSAGDDG